MLKSCSIIVLTALSWKSACDLVCLWLCHQDLAGIWIKSGVWSRAWQNDRSPRANTGHPSRTRGGRTSPNPRRAAVTWHIRQTASQPLLRKRESASSMWTLTTFLRQIVTTVVANCCSTKPNQLRSRHSQRSQPRRSETFNGAIPRLPEMTKIRKYRGRKKRDSTSGCRMTSSSLKPAKLEGIQKSISRSAPPWRAKSRKLCAARTS